MKFSIYDIILGLDLDLGSFHILDLHIQDAQFVINLAKENGFKHTKDYVRDAAFIELFSW